jgi:hypothetical protein
MSYEYHKQRPKLFTESGQDMLLKMRDRAFALIDSAGAVSSGKLLLVASMADTWDKLACMDYMVERGDLREVTGSDVAGQCRVFVRGRSS